MNSAGNEFTRAAERARGDAGLVATRWSARVRSASVALVFHTLLARNVDAPSRRVSIEITLSGWRFRALRWSCGLDVSKDEQSTTAVEPVLGAGWGFQREVLDVVVPDAQRGEASSAATSRVLRVCACVCVRVRACACVLACDCVRVRLLSEQPRLR